MCKSFINDNVSDGFDLFLTLDGPTDLKHRCVTEDAAYGTVLMVSRAEICGTGVSVSRALLTTAFCINEDDYLDRDSTLENMVLPALEYPNS